MATQYLTAIIKFVSDGGRGGGNGESVVGNMKEATNIVSPFPPPIDAPLKIGRASISG